MTDLRPLTGKRIVDATWMVIERQLLEPPQPNLRCLRLTFEDGSAITVMADADVFVSYEEGVQWLAPFPSGLLSPPKGG